MTCKRSEQCDNADICQFAKSTEYNLLGGSCFTPKDPQTNEEWLKSCTTEQLAKALKEMTDKCATCDTNQYDQRGECPFEICRIGLNEFVEWLKKPHTNE